MSSNNQEQRKSKFAGYDAFAAVDAAVMKDVLTSDSQDSWHRHASENRNRAGLHRSGAYTSQRHAPAFPKLGQWRADPTGINDGHWKPTDQKLAEKAEINRRKKIWQDEKAAARVNKRRATDVAMDTDTTESSTANPAPDIKKMKIQASKKEFNPEDVYLSVSVGGKLEGSMHFTLYDAVAPRTAANFRALCAGTQ